MVMLSKDNLVTPRLFITLIALSALCLFAASCDIYSGTQPTVDATVRVDADTIPDAVPGPIDGSVGVACGTLTCTTADECCITSSNGDAGSGGANCVPKGTCSGGLYDCDGPEDCSATQQCCDAPGETKCVSSGTCQGVIVCNAAADCPGAGDSCCESSSGGNNFCSPFSCP